MKKVLLLVEGQTEERFVLDVLAPHFAGSVLVPIIVATKRVKTGGKFRGGVASYEKVHDELRRLLRDTSAAVVTTLIDLYGLPADFPGMDSPKTGRERAQAIEAAMASAHPYDRRFLPHLSVYEIETYLFVNPERVSVFDATQRDAMAKIRDQYRGDVELINDGPTTHPSMRIKAMSPGYDKVVSGALALRETGVSQLTAACPHFGRWIEALKSRLEDP